MITFYKFLSSFLVYLKLINIWAHACTGGMDPNDPNRFRTDPNWPQAYRSPQHQYMALSATTIQQPTPLPLLNSPVVREINDSYSLPIAITPITNKARENNEKEDLEGIATSSATVKNQIVDQIHSISENIDNLPNKMTKAAEDAAKSVADTIKESGQSIMKKLNEITFPEKLQPLADYAKQIFSGTENKKIQWDQVSYLI